MTVNRCTTAYLILILAVFPLVTLGEYYSILFIKWAFCMAITAAFVIVAIVVLLTRKNIGILRLEESGERTWTEILFLICSCVYAAGILAGLAICDHKAENFFGLGGRFLGVSVMLLCLAALIGVSMHYRKSVLVSGCTGVAAAIVFTLQIINSLGFDPLGMKTGIIDSQADLFISTLGNLNFNATFDCVIIGAVAANLAINKGSSTRQKTAMILLLVLGTAGAVSCRSMGVILGLAAVVIVMGWYWLWKKGMIKTAAIICACVAFAVMIAAFVVWVIKSDGHAGHNRVFIWKETLKMFAAYPVSEKLFGCGINEFQYAIYDFCGSRMNSEGYNIFTDAHSEYLQALASSGTVGFCGYFGMMAATICEGVNRVKANPLALIGITVICAFLAQGLVYNPQIATTPILLTMIGIFWSRDFREKGNV